MGSFMQTDSREHQVDEAVSRCIGALSFAVITGKAADYYLTLERMRGEQDIGSDNVDALIEITKKLLVRAGVQQLNGAPAQPRYPGLDGEPQAHYAAGGD